MAFFKKKTAEQPQEAMSLEDVMKKFDRESNTRIWEGTPKWIVTCILALFSVFCIYVTLVATWLDEIRLTSFMAFIMFIGYLVFPAKKGVQKVNHMPWYDIILMLAGTGAFLYFTINATEIVSRFKITSLEVAIGVINNKTTAVRLIPVYGKGVGESVEFGGLLGHAPIMKLSEYSCYDFIHRGGRIPAPIHSQRN